MKFKLHILIILVTSFVSVNAQTEIVAAPGEYIEAQNYGGKVEFKRFFHQEINYPKKALANKTEGTVEVSCIVDLKGNTSKVHIKKSVSKIAIHLQCVSLQFIKFNIQRNRYVSTRIDSTDGSTVGRRRVFGLAFC